MNFWKRKTKPNERVIRADGKRYRFQVVKNTCEPCPQCGVLACGQEDILWYETEKKRIAWIFDGGLFDLAGEEFFAQYLPENDYQTLPQFMQEWRELRGWEDCWDYDGYPLEIDDFLRALTLLRACEMGKWINEEDLDGMEQLAKEAQAQGAPLKIVRG